MIGKASVTGKMVLVGKLAFADHLLLVGALRNKARATSWYLRMNWACRTYPAPPWPVVFGITFSGAIGRTNRKSFSNISTTSGGPLHKVCFPGKR